MTSKYSRERSKCSEPWLWSEVSCQPFHTFHFVFDIWEIIYYIILYYIIIIYYTYGIFCCSTSSSHWKKKIGALSYCQFHFFYCIHTDHTTMIWPQQEKSHLPVMRLHSTRGHLMPLQFDERHLFPPWTRHFLFGPAAGLCWFSLSTFLQTYCGQNEKTLMFPASYRSQPGSQHIICWICLFYTNTENETKILFAL